MQNINKKTYIILAIFLVAIPAMVSYLVRGNISQYGSRVDKRLPDRSPERLFQAQTTTITGKILSVNGKVITVQNGKKLVGDIPLADDVKITDSAGIVTKEGKNTIETNKEVSLLLQLFGDTYKVVTITYVPEIPPVPTISIQSVLSPTGVTD